MFVFVRSTEVVAPRIAVVVHVTLHTVITGVAKKYGALVNVISSEAKITTTATKTTTMVTCLGSTSTTRYGAVWWTETVSLVKNL